MIKLYCYLLYYYNAFERIRLLNKDFDSFYEYIQSFEKTPEIICLSETRRRDKTLINIEIPI